MCIRDSVKAPDALYNSHIALARIHRDSGDLDGSLAQLQQALALAPTTAQPFVDESITYVDIAGDHAKGELYSASGALT